MFVIRPRNYDTDHTDSTLKLIQSSATRERALTATLQHSVIKLSKFCTTTIICRLVVKQTCFKDLFLSARTSAALLFPATQNRRFSYNAKYCNLLNFHKILANKIYIRLLFNYVYICNPTDKDKRRTTSDFYCLQSLSIIGIS